jgi:hypothetical protein
MLSISGFIGGSSLIKFQFVQFIFIKRENIFCWLCHRFSFCGQLLFWILLFVFFAITLQSMSQNWNVVNEDKNNPPLLLGPLCSTYLDRLYVNNQLKCFCTKLFLSIFTQTRQNFLILRNIELCYFGIF